MDILGFEKAIYHYDKIEKLRQGVPQFPVHATVSLGNYCNHKCLWCTVYKYQQSLATTIPYDKLMNFLSRARFRGLKAVGYVGNGEPTAFPEFGRLVAEIDALGLQQGMFTNGLLLDRFEDEVLDCFTYVRISLDAGSTEVHDEMHDVRGHFDRIIANVARIIERRTGPNPTLGIQYATHHRNLHDLHEAVRIARDIGADYFSVKPVFNRGSVGARIEKNQLTFEDLNPAVAKARQDFEGRDFKIYFRPFQIMSEEEDRNVLPYDRCVAASFNVNIYEDETIVGCGPRRVPGGRLDDDFEDIERRILELPGKLDLSKCPGGCRYHALNHIVDTVLNPSRSDQFHANFM